MKRNSDNAQNVDSKFYIITHSKPVIISFSALVLLIVTLLTIKLIVYIQNVRFQKELEAEMNNEMSFPDVQLTRSDLRAGKYYLDGDTNNYYFEVTDDDTIELVASDEKKREIFEKDNPGNDEAIASDLKDYDGPKHFTTETIKFNGALFIKTDVIWDEEFNTYLGSGGMMLLDPDTMQWGEGRYFTYIPDSTATDISSDTSTDTE